MPILNVVDHAPTRYLRSRILEAAGFEVREAESAEQALSSGLSATPPDLVLLDVGLPDGDGFTVCQQLKTAHPNIDPSRATTIVERRRS